jgi:uncharacterized protein (DUF3084 family)
VQLKDLKTDIRKKDEEVRALDAANKKASQAKQLAEQKVARLEKAKLGEVRFLFRNGKGCYCLESL